MENTIKNPSTSSLCGEGELKSPPVHEVLASPGQQFSSITHSSAPDYKSGPM